jgi:hypothetical protein
MKKIVLFASLLGLFVFGGIRFASAKAPWKRDLGIENCNACHVEGKLKDGKGDYAGKKTCNDCHQGKQKPAK